MNKQSQEAGSINILVVPLILSVIFLFGALGFGIWAYTSRQDYKNNTDAKIADAVEVAQQETATAKDTEFIEREKQPLKEYKGPTSLGSLSIKYPKTWSAYVDESGDGSEGIDGYFHPNFVPDSQSETSFALRVQVVNQTYSEELESFDSDVKEGKTKAVPYKPLNVEGVIGTQLTGSIGDQKNGILVLLPLRDKTIKIWTEAEQFTTDFNNNILANFKFTP